MKENRFVFTWGWDIGLGVRTVIPEDTENLRGDRYVYYLIVVMDSWIYSYVKTYQIV